MNENDLLPSQSLISHLAELRVRLIQSIYGILAGVALCYSFTNQIFDFMRAPIAPYLPMGGLVFTAPMDKFIAHLKIAFFGGVLLACPWWLYQIWKFIGPGLYKKERKVAVGFISSGTFLFVGGISFAYYIVFPMAFKFLMGYGGDVDKPMITIDQYMSFFLTTSVMFGFAFELPLILVTLGILGIIDQSFLKKKRRYAIVVLAAASAIMTPPDLLSMLMMLGPMILLYEISVFFVGFFERRAAART